MEIHILPQDLTVNDSPSIQVFNYRSEQNIQKAKVNLTKNTISFLREGQKEIIGDNEAIQLTNQKFVIMKSGKCLMTEKVSSKEQFYKSILLFFSDEMVIDFLERYQLYVKSKKASKSFYAFKYDDFINHFVEGLENVATLPAIIQEKILKTKFDEIMLYLSHQYGPSFLNTIIKKVNHHASRLTQIVESNRHNKLTLQELSFLANMSVSTFKREFVKHYQKSPIKWFNDERLEHIAILLRTNQKRPIDLYEEAGYENFSNFVQAFKKRFGITPKQYQAQSQI